MKNYIKQAFGKKQNIQYGVLFNKIKYDLRYNTNLTELEITIKAKEMIKEMIKNGMIGQFFYPYPGKNFGYRLTISNEKYVSLRKSKAMEEKFEVKRG